MNRRRSRYKMGTKQGGATNPKGSITSKMPKPVDPASKSLFRDIKRGDCRFKKIKEALE